MCVCVCVCVCIPLVMGGLQIGFSQFNKSVLWYGGHRMMRCHGGKLTYACLLPESFVLLVAGRVSGTQPVMFVCMGGHTLPERCGSPHQLW